MAAMNLLKQFLLFPQKKWDDSPDNWNLDFEDVSIPISTRVTLSAWWLKGSKPDGEAILFFHGNAGNISHRLFKAVPLIQKGYDILLVDYRGYGKSTGSIESAADFSEDGEKTLEWVREEKHLELDQIILFGESLGSITALELASKHAVKAVVLEGVFTSAEDLIKRHYPFVPPGALGDFRVDNMEKIRQCRAPLLMLHGTADSICPISMAETLLNAAPGPKEFFKVEGADHNDLPIVAGKQFAERIDGFIRKQG